MKLYKFTLVGFLFICEKSLGQLVVPASMNCSKVIQHLSYFWKLDSLANNGFRVYAFRNLLDSKIDSISADYLTRNFGRPDTIWKNEAGVFRIYFCFRRKNLSEQWKGLFDDIYISFKFDDGEKKLLSIKHSYFDN